MATERATDVRDETLAASSSLEDLIDLEFEALCARELGDDVTLDEVRKATASIPGSMAEAITEERADRFWMVRPTRANSGLCMYGSPTGTGGSWGSPTSVRQS